MPIYIQPVTEQHQASVLALRHIVEAVELVDSYSTDYLVSAPGAHNILIVDREFLARERVGDVLRVLGELDGIVSGGWEWSLMEAVTPEAVLRADTVERARVLADAIREGMGQPRVYNVDEPEAEVVDEPAPAIKRTGQRARVEQSIVAGQPRAVYEVHVVEIDGDTLHYTTDANPSWYSTATRSEFCDWSLIEDEAGL
jgi:hypothetical protein